MVTVVCISYNHADFVVQALSSVLEQTYDNIQLIVADDASTDESAFVIREFVKQHSSYDITCVFNEQNTGNCTLFNKALKLAKGQYVIDLSADDYLYKNCIEEQVKLFEQLPAEVGVVFSNVHLVDAKGMFIKSHYAVDTSGRSIESIPQGDVYCEVLRRYFISPVGMMMRKSILDELGGYDEILAYEDFDFWIRSSRLYKYVYLDKCLVAKRILPQSHSSKFESKHYHEMFLTTLKVCQKAAWLNNTVQERDALLERIYYELRQAIKYNVKPAVKGYFLLLREQKGSIIKRLFYKVWYYMNTLK